MQEPMPSHVPCVVWVSLTHDAEAHIVPAAYFEHAPAPLQPPTLPQLDAACIGHWLLGSSPAFTGPQAPSAP
jgi:hypothetical protein